MERLYKELQQEERKEKCLKTELAIWDEFWKWMEILNPAGGGNIEKVVNYTFNYNEPLMNYLLDGRCEISN